MVSVTRGKSAHRVKRAAAAARILAATERLLRSGERFTEIPVERLLAEADVSRSTFYVHFADKSALLIAVAEDAVDDVMETAERWWQADHAGPEDAERTVRELIKVYRKHAPILRTLAEVGAYDDQIADMWRSRRQRYTEYLVERYQREQDAGIISPGVDVELTAIAVGQLVDTTILEHVAYGSPKRDRQLAQTIARIGWLAYYGRLPQ